MNKILFVPGLCLGVLAVFLATLHQDFRWVDAGGHSVRVLELGGLGPTVVFEAGAGGPLESWARVQPAVSAFAHTIAYDRAGNGLSPLGPVPRDGRQIARELHTLLHNASAQPPYILVGHSLGGPDIRMFASLYPSEVAGLVLVDPTQEDLIAWAKAREPQPQTPRRLRLDDEVDCARLTFAELKTNGLPAEVPIVLISGLGPREMPGFLSEQLKAEVQKDREILYPAKLKFHKAWVEQFPHGRLVVTENSGHGIPWEEPELLTAAIRQVVKSARAQSNLSGP